MTLAKTCNTNNMMQDLKKQLMGLLQPQKLSELQCFNIPLLYLKKLNPILKVKVMNKSDICSTHFCCKFHKLHFCQILFELVFISHCYHESNKGELFFETQCIFEQFSLYLDLESVGKWFCSW